MRIVAGLYGGRKLQVPKGHDIRPTSDKVRGAIFNTLGSYIDAEGVHVLDAFCGTGALGLEAISRGASRCVFIDKAGTSIDLAKENADSLNIADQCDFVLGDAAKVQLNQQFDLVFLDPPYGQGLLVPVLEHLVRQELLCDYAMCVLESEKQLDLTASESFETLKEKEYGDTRVTYLRYK